MTEMFRFAVFRGPRASESEHIELSMDSNFARKLDELIASNRGEAQRHCTALTRSSEFVATFDSLFFGREYRHALSQLRSSASTEGFRAWISSVFGSELEQIVVSDEFERDRQRVLDSLLAIKLARGTFPFAETLLRVARLQHAMKRVAAGSVMDAELGALLRAGISYPRLGVARSASSGETPTAASQLSAPAKPSAGRSAKLRTAMNEVRRAIVRRQFVETPAPRIVESASVPVAPTTVLSRAIAAVRDAGATVALAGESTAVPFTLSEGAKRALSSETRTILDEEAIELGDRSAWEVANRLHQALLAAAPEPRNRFVFYRNGAAQFWFIPELRFPRDGVSPAMPIPTSTGLVRPAGIGDLLVVEQQILRYEPTEVCEIDNVPRGTSRSSERRRLDVVEDTTLYETERQQDTETEQSTTERFELKQETERTIREDASLKAGVSISGSYGPSVEFSTSVEGGMERSTEETSQRAVDYGKDVVTRSVSRISERVLSRRQRVFRREVEHKARDERDNRSGEEHIRGVFQWVDKVYQAQVFDYGKRLMFDFVVPEPAALLRHALAQGTESVLPQPIPPLTATAADIDEETYMGLAALYGATDIEAPPEPYITLSATFAKVLEGGVDGKRVAEEKTVEIPVGYAAQQCYVDLGISKGGAWWFDVWVGQWKFRNRHDQTTFQRGGAGLSGETKSIPLGVHAGNVNAYTVIIEVLCEVTASAKDQWRHETLEKIRAAYELRVREREESIALAENSPRGIAGAGRNPAANRALEGSEIKRACISLLGSQRFELFDATRTLAGSRTPDYPELDFAEATAEGAYIRFLEQAFEWEQMTYVFYPYYWSRKEHWLERLLDRDDDPQFEAFLRAGAARSLVPVRPGFEQAVLHYLETGEVWNGSGEAPPIGDPLYLALVDEIRARTERLEERLAVREPWEVRVPTELRWLRRAESLPFWTKAGERWVPDDGA